MRVSVRSLCLVLLVVSWPHSYLKAQQTIWSEDFTYHYQQNFGGDWATSGSSYPWTCDLVYLIGTVCFPNTGNNTRVAGVSDYYLPQRKYSICGQDWKTETNVLLMAPNVSLTGFSDVWFRYDSYFLGQSQGGTTESATVEVSTDSGRSWTVLKSAPVVQQGGAMNSSYVNLSAYAGRPAVRLGFRYSDSGAHMNGWMIDNLKMFVPVQNDLALVKTYPEDTLLSYTNVPASIQVSGAVMNNGLQPVTAFDVAWREGNGPVQTFNVSGVNIRSFDTIHFNHSIPYSLSSVGRHDLRVWVVATGDVNHANDTMPLLIHGAQFTPVKKLAIEEGTGSWNIMGPRGHVYLHALDATDDPPTRISVHSGDVMENKPYADYLYYAYQVFTPYFIFDRRGPVRHEDFFSQYQLQKNYFGFADLDLSLTALAGQVSVDVNVKPAVDLVGAHRLALVITEDDVHGLDSGYAQANGYAGGAVGPMGGYENKPDPVPASQMKYDYVARSISPAPDGGAACLPALMKPGLTYTCNMHSTYSTKSVFSRLNAVVLLIREKDSSILNSRTMRLSTLGVGELTTSGPAFFVYPVPAHDIVTVAVRPASRMKSSITITDLTGRAIYQDPAGWIEAGLYKKDISVGTWPSGMYIVTLDAGGYREVVKLVVVH